MIISMAVEAVGIFSRSGLVVYPGDSVHQAFVGREVPWRRRRFAFLGSRSFDGYTQRGIYIVHTHLCVYIYIYIIYVYTYIYSTHTHI